jgi:hypothetical protein
MISAKTFIEQCRGAVQHAKVFRRQLQRVGGILREYEGDNFPESTATTIRRASFGLMLVKRVS